MLAVGAALVIAPVAGTAAAGSSAAATTTTTTTVPARAQFTAEAVPCAAATTGAPCTADPSQLQVTYPSSDLSIRAVEVTWVPGSGRPSGAPAPKPTSAILSLATSQKCTQMTATGPGYETACWPWPLTHQTSTDDWILNGTYQVTACNGFIQGGSCAASKAYTPQDVALAVPPAPPTAVHASTSSAGVVALTWSPAAASAPDLIGYQVTRDGQVVYGCNLDGAGPGAGVKCPSPLSYQGLVAAGNWTFGVAALRYGASPSAAAAVASALVTRSVEVALVGPASGTPPAVQVALPPVPVVATPTTIAPVVLPTTVGVVSTTTTTDPPASEALPYGNPPSSQDPAALGGDPKETGPKNSDLDTLSGLALGLIALALAVHVWYLRGELRLFARRNQVHGSV